MKNVSAQSTSPASDAEANDEAVELGFLPDNIWWLAGLAVVMWLVYFATAYPPGGAPFIYAEF